MKAIRIHNYGGSEVLQYEDAPRPEPQAGELLIRVHAAGVNPIDWKVREGHMKDFWPRIPAHSGVGCLWHGKRSRTGRVAIQNRRRGFQRD